MRQKVQAYITRERGGVTEVLVFDHADAPEAGVQVPAGSIDPGETPDQAVLREAREEAGLADLRIVKYLGCFPWYYVAPQVVHQRHVYQLATGADLPDRWEHVVTGAGVDNGMRFVYYWLPVGEAEAVLSGQQGMYLPLL